MTQVTRRPLRFATKFAVLVWVIMTAVVLINYFTGRQTSGFVCFGLVALTVWILVGSE